ncbi:MAG: hypothetical protein WCC69_03740 [Pirellulales bacterium]
MPTSPSITATPPSRAGVATVVRGVLLALASCHVSMDGQAAAPDAARGLTAQLEVMQRRDPAIGIRGLLRFTLEAAGTGWNPPAVEEALQLARSMQDQDSASPTFGNYRWRLGDDAVTDPNAVEFATQLTSLLRLTCADSLTPAARDLLDELHRDALVAIQRHVVKPGYTNIHLMRAWNLFALGRLGDTAADRAGRAAWQQWLDHVACHGITEYSSPTYYGIDLDSLGLITRHAGDATIRREAASALTFLWTAIAANWFPPAERLAGPHSRDYDYLFGHGSLDDHLHQAGWLTRPPFRESAGWLTKPPYDHLTVFRTACRWTPPADLHDGLATRAPRFVVQRFNAEPWARSTNHIGATLAIGVAGECRGPEDKSLAIHLPGGPGTANVTLVIDGRNDPYGRRKEPTAHGGQSKAHHLRTFLASSQRGPRVVAAWMFDPAVPAFKADPDDLTCLKAHLIMPAEAEVWSANDRLTDGATLPGDAVFFIRQAEAVVGFRSLLAAADGSAPRGFCLRTDAPHIGGQRLTATLHDGQPHGRSLVAFDIEARERCGDASFADFRREFTARRVTAAASSDRLRIKGTLPLETDLAVRRPLVCEPLLAPADVLLIDGTEIGRPLLPIPD